MIRDKKCVAKINRQWNKRADHYDAECRPRFALLSWRGLKTKQFPVETTTRQTILCTSTVRHWLGNTLSPKIEFRGLALAKATRENAIDGGVVPRERAWRRSVTFIPLAPLCWRKVPRCCSFHAKQPVRIERLAKRRTSERNGGNVQTKSEIDSGRPISSTIVNWETYVLYASCILARFLSLKEISYGNGGKRRMVQEKLHVHFVNEPFF